MTNGNRFIASDMLRKRSDINKSKSAVTHLTQRSRFVDTNHHLTISNSSIPLRAFTHLIW